MPQANPEATAVNAGNLPSAPLWRRLAAIFYDSFLAGALLMLIGALYLSAKVALLGAATAEQQNQGYDPLLSTLLLFTLFFFFALCWRRNGQTLGMQAWRIRIQTEQGQIISWWQCLLRFLCAWPSVGFGAIGLFWSLIDPKQLAWHDRFSLSRVVLLPKR